MLSRRNIESYVSIAVSQTQYIKSYLEILPPGNGQLDEAMSLLDRAANKVREWARENGVPLKGLE
ncbi:hypothetical protein [Mycolicibacterium phlei]|uniref:hypothetical protein n=1 Tax=Mycolicibacterium phlei TaxID=1771 RepID=UPI0002F087BA|nr:hypothetical protein [Mycolicibacterium phlei]MBF4194564.1 hypothetical protein [Mycolicibacterium phlei]